jgi:hypothetical protein
MSSRRLNLPPHRMVRLCDHGAVVLTRLRVRRLVAVQQASTNGQYMLQIKQGVGEVK